MITTLTRIALCLTVGVTFLGCKSAAPQQDTPSPAQALAEPVAIHDLYCKDGDEALSEHVLKLITSAEELEAIDSEALSDIEIDFDANHAVLLTMGERSTGGYWIMIDDIQAVGDVLYVRGTANAPAEDDSVTQALTYPYCVAIIEKGTPTTLRSEINSVTGHDMDMD